MRLVLAQFWTTHAEDTGLRFVNTLAVASRMGVTAHGGPIGPSQFARFGSHPLAASCVPTLPGQEIDGAMFLSIHIFSKHIVSNNFRMALQLADLSYGYRGLWMAQIDAILHTLSQGKSVRREEWEPYVRMFVLNDILMCQYSDAKPWEHSLTWGEISALDWEPVRATPVVQLTNRTPATPPSAQRAPGLALQSTPGDAGMRRNSFLLRFFPHRRGV